MLQLKRKSLQLPDRLLTKVYKDIVMGYHNENCYGLALWKDQHLFTVPLSTRFQRGIIIHRAEEKILVESLKKETTTALAHCLRAVTHRQAIFKKLNCYVNSKSNCTVYWN